MCKVLELVHTWFKVPWVLQVWTELLTTFWHLLLLCISDVQGAGTVLVVCKEVLWQIQLIALALECLSNFMLSDNPFYPELFASFQIV